MTDPYLTREKSRFETEKSLLQAYPLQDLADIIRDVGFSCTCCANCCRAGQNGHVFLLDSDTTRARRICPDSLIPAPFFEVCDRQGRFYVSGYALRTLPDGSCIHLQDGRCLIYEDRFSICRVYPYMLHREPDDRGRLGFRQISGLNEHGEYHTEISPEQSFAIAQETRAYEEEWLSQMIRFYESLILLFESTGERHVRKVYDQQMKKFRQGERMEVLVFHAGQWYPHTVSIADYSGILE